LKDETIRAPEAICSLFSPLDDAVPRLLCKGASYYRVTAELEEIVKYITI